MQPELRYGVMVALQILVLSVQVRILVSQRKPSKLKNIKDLDGFSIKNGSETGQAREDHTSNQLFSLYDTLKELCKEKKMHFFKPTPGIEYVPAKISEGKEWCVYYYVLDPATNRLCRIRKKINRIKNLRERRKIGRKICEALNERLALGWNPMMEKTAPKSSTDIQDAFDAFLAAKKKTAEDNSLRCYRSFIDTMKRWLAANVSSNGHFPAMAFSYQIANEFMSDIDENDGISAQTYNNYLRFFIILFNWMKEKGYIQENPFDSIKRKSKRLIKKKRRMMSDEELAALTGFLRKNNTNYLAMCLCCYCCFMRPKEIALLKCGDIDLKKQTIHIRPEIAKNDNDSYRTIPDDMLPYFNAIDLSDPKAYVFSDTPDYTFMPGRKKVLTQHIARYWSDVIRPACGFPMEVQFYSLKDTGITNMLGSGVPVSFVKQQADHHSLAMTSVYLGQVQGANETLKKTKIIKQ